jgi:hypothetical protein
LARKDHHLLARRRRPTLPTPAVRVDTVNGQPYRHALRDLTRWGIGRRVERATGTVDGHPAVWTPATWNRRCTCPAAPEGCRCPDLLRATVARAVAARLPRDAGSQPRRDRTPAVLPPWWLLALLAVAVVVAADLIGR